MSAILKPGFYFILFLFFNQVIKSQSCSSCDVLNDSLTEYITSVDTNAYTVNTGYTFCVNKAGTFKGTITVNGGTICNKGRFFPKSITFTSGTLVNSNNIRLKTGISVSSGRTITNNHGAVMNVNGNLTIGGGTLFNDGLINVGGDMENNSGAFANRSIVNCAALTGTNTINTYGSGLINTKN